MFSDTNHQQDHKAGAELWSALGDCVCEHTGVSVCPQRRVVLNTCFNVDKTVRRGSPCPGPQALEGLAFLWPFSSFIPACRPKIPRELLEHTPEYQRPRDSRSKWLQNCSQGPPCKRTLPPIYMPRG